MLRAHLQAADASLPSACFLIRVFGWAFFNADQGGMYGDAAWWSRSLYLQLLPPQKKDRAAQPLAPHHGQRFGCSVGMGAEGCR